METLPPTDSFYNCLPSLIGAPIGDYRADMGLENRLVDYGHTNIAGVDEAGRGPLAGPVVAAAVILDRNNIPDGLNDSKILSPAKRQQLYQEIMTTAYVGVASAGAATIDRINIRQATLSCMQRAVAALQQCVDWSLIDGRDVPHALQGKATAVIKGDGRSKSIAAASIIAKVVRDEMMMQASKTMNQYGFENHKGYGTKEHMAAIEKHGPCCLHRTSFSPIRQHKLFE